MFFVLQFIPCKCKCQIKRKNKYQYDFLPKNCSFWHKPGKLISLQHTDTVLQKFINHHTAFCLKKESNSGCHRLRSSILFSVVFTPSPCSHHGSVWFLPVSSLLLTNTLSPVRARLSIWWEKFVGPKKKTIVGLLVIDPLCSEVKKILSRHIDIIGDRAAYSTFLLPFFA